ncbi:MAG: flagellar motor protein MotB [Desulfobacterales bacterium]|nr:flagellar motor protein MotB [Desulfobacterales bacterium]
MKPRQDQFEGGGQQSGIRLLIISLFIILLAFFVVINSIAIIDERRKFEAMGSLTGSFGVLPGGLSPLKGELEEISPSQPPVLSDESKISETETKSEPLSLQTSQEGKVVSIQDRMIFDEGSLTIRRPSYDFLKRLCDVINQDSYSVEIVGNTDNRPPDQDLLHSNWELSALKAQEVLKFFVSIGKVDPARLTAYGCGEYKPVASNETKETRAQNRRVDIILDRRSEGGLSQIYRKEPSRFFVFKRFLFRMVD